MMDRAVDNRANGRLAGNLRTKFEVRLRSARATLADASRPLFDLATETAAAATAYVRGNPWTAVGVAIAAGVLIDLLSAKR